MALAAVLFDFDGTLVDTRTASWPLFERTNREFALGIDSREQYFALFEHNFYEGLAAHCGDADRADAAAQHFLQLIGEHYDPPFVSGVSELLRRLDGHVTLAIVSSNTRATIMRILVRDGLEGCFGTILGGDVETSKTHAIKRFMNGDGGRAYAAGEVVLVTDTTGDVSEAHGAGIAAYGVAWGMHTRTQLLTAGAVAVAGQPEELYSWLTGQDNNKGGSVPCRAAP